MKKRMPVSKLYTKRAAAYRALKTVCGTLAAASFLMLFKAGTSPLYGLFLIPFALFMYLSGGCCYSMKRRRSHKPAASVYYVDDFIYSPGGKYPGVVQGHETRA